MTCRLEPNGDHCAHHLNPWPCATGAVLDEVSAERSHQVDRYGTNHDLRDGTGPMSEWMRPLTNAPAADIEALFRGDYEDVEAHDGKPTWALLVREEVAEAFAETDPARLRAELVQVAALCVSWVEKLDAR